MIERSIRTPGTEVRTAPHAGVAETALIGLLVMASLGFAVASAVHFGVRIELGPVRLVDPFAGAAIPEVIIAVVLAFGTVAALVRRPASWGAALGASLFAFVATCFGLTITASTG